MDIKSYELTIACGDFSGKDSNWFDNSITIL